MIWQACGRSSVRIGIAFALLAGFATFSASAQTHEATRTTVAFTSTQTEITDPGEEWVDEAGIYHLRGLTELDDISGDIAGSAVVVINIDFQAVGECTEVSCPGYIELWGTVRIEDENGRWSGRFLQSLSDVPEDEYAFSSIALHGRDGNAGMSFFGEFVDESETSVTLEGILSTMATPHQGLHASVTVCFGEESVGGSFLGSGAVAGFGQADAIFIDSGGPWTHSYNIMGLVELSNDAGSLTVGFVLGGQENGLVSFGFGNFVVTGGAGAYEELYGHGRVIGAAAELPQCASGFGVRLSLYGVAHLN